jgi:hypothetical protein
MICNACGSPVINEAETCSACGAIQQQPAQFDFAAPMAGEPNKAKPMLILAARDEADLPASGETRIEGVRGWLLIFSIVSLVVASLLLVEMLVAFSSIPFYAGLWILSATLHIVASVLLLLRRRSSLAWIKSAIVIDLLWGVPLLVVSLLGGVSSLVSSSGDNALDAWRYFLASGLLVLCALSSERYFMKSVRVRSTYGRNLWKRRRKTVY